MALPRTRPPRRVLTGSAARLGDPQSSFAKRQKLGWQQRALEYVDLIPELSYASRFYSRMLNQLRIYPAMLDDEGNPTPVDDPVAIGILERVQDPGGGMSQILSNYGRLMMITGEGTLFGRYLETPGETWSFVWNDELDIELNADKSVRAITWKPNGSGDEGTKFGPREAVAYRMWTPHPRSSGEADSPMRSVLQIAEEMLVLTQSVMATATSRKTNGILCLAQELSPGPAAPEGDEDPQNDPFLEDLTEHLVAQSENAGSPEASAPFVLWGAGDYIGQDKAHMLWMHDRQNDYAEKELRLEARDRMALGMDMPPEALKGLGDSNHWAAKQIQEEMWRSHGSQKATQFCNDLNAAYYRPALREAGVDNWQRIVVAYDEDRVVTLTDRSDDADKALDRRAISFRGYRQMKRIPESLAPGEDDEELFDKMKPSQNGSAPQRDPADGPPPPGPEGDSGRRTRVVGSSVKELGAAEMALMRCRELAGARIKNRERACPDCVSGANGKPMVLVAAAVGPANVKRLNLEPRELVKGGTDSLRPLLLEWGYTEAQANSVCEMIEIYAYKTLFEEKAVLPAAAEAQIQLIKEMAAA